MSDDQPEAEAEHQELHPAERVAEPVPLLPLAQEDLHAGHRQHDQPQADVIEAERLAPHLGALGLEVVGVAQHGVVDDQGEQAGRDVDEEDPFPGVVVGDVAAERRPEHRRDQGRDAEERLRRALLLGREGVDQHGLRDRLQPAAAQPLEDAEDDQLRQRPAPARRPPS